ncbi:MAG: FMN-binding negative transcriptional regulator [Rhizobacter sp.]|nr:FMN-binding negative transcriptional regulator [Rhizobacter sp.]
MYLPDHFSEARPHVLRAFVRDHPLGLLVTQNRAGGIDANSVPFVLDAEGDGPGVLRAHVARANALWKTARDDVDALVVFQGPQGYVSPAWYPSKAEHGKVVPTWNYLMVQARGRLRAIDDRAWLREFVSRLTDRHEAARPAPWAVTDAPGDYLDTMLGAIVGIEIALASLVGKWKVSQNRSAADRAGVVEGLAREGGDAALAGEVRAPGGG